MKFNIYKSEITKEILENYYIATFYLESSVSLEDAAWNLAIGQSIGNPSARSEFETEELYENHACLVLSDKKDLQNKSGIVQIAFPVKNINFKRDGISQLLVQIMGGQLDIDTIKKCQLEDISFPESMMKEFKGPIIGLKEMKDFCNAHNRPLFGGITKPKVGLSPEKHLDLVKRLVDGGCDFIKEDEILSDPEHCPIEKRVPLVMEYIKSQNRKVFYCVSIHADHDEILERVKKVYELGGNGIHVNFHCGLGVYKSIRKLNLPLLVHFQKSGDKILNNTQHNYHINQNVIFKLAALSGASTLHVGMIGGYSTTENDLIKKIIKNMNEVNSVPALSCGMHAGLIDNINDILGHNNWMANVGGALSSHPMGTLAGTKAIYQAVTNQKNEKEYLTAIEKWGYKK